MHANNFLAESEIWKQKNSENIGNIQMGTDANEKKLILEHLAEFSCDESLSLPPNGVFFWNNLLFKYFYFINQDSNN